MAFAEFGPGIIIVTRTDIPNQTPINVGYAQELTLNVKGKSVKLYGTNQFPLVVARGTIDATAKFTAAEISGIAWNSFFYGMSSFTAGGYQWNVSEQHAVPAGGTLTVTNGGSFDQDLGVLYDATALPVIKGSTAPGAGSYEQTAGGVYTFNTADAGKTVDVTYSSSNAAGQSLVITNQAIGTTPTFQLDYYTNLSGAAGGQFAVRLFACVADSHEMPFKLEDFAKPTFDASFFALTNGKVMEYVFPQVG